MMEAILSYGRAMDKMDQGLESTHNYLTRLVHSEQSSESALRLKTTKSMLMSELSKITVLSLLGVAIIKMDQDGERTGRYSTVRHRR